MKRTIVLVVLAMAGSPAAAAEAKFAVEPKASRTQDRTAITFAVSGPTDVEVAIADGQGRVVRHLAAGALGGKFPPPEPLKPGLAQSLAWDGKDDSGQVAAGGPFKVRVRAGMQVSLGRTIADSPYNLNGTYCRGLAVDSKGDLYMLGQKSRDGVLFFLRAYDRTGQYLRELMPYPATLSATDREAFGSISLGEGLPAAPQNYYSLWPVFYPFAYYGRAPQVKLAAIAGEQLVLISEAFDTMYRLRKNDGGPAARPFVEPLWTGPNRPNAYNVGPLMATMAPDGKAVYFTGYCGVPAKGAKLHDKWPEGRIYKAPWPITPGSIQPFADVAIPEEAKPPAIGWNITGHLQAIHGIATDKAGRVYVADSAGGKVWIFDAAGKAAGSVECPFAHGVVVKPGGDVLYVLTRDARVHGAPKKTLVRIADGKVTDTLGGFPDRGGAMDPFLAGDFTAAAPQLWLSGCPRECSLLRIEDRDGKLTVVEDLADRAPGKTDAGSAARLAVDPEADLVYFNDGWEKNYRYSGLTGEYAGKVDKDGRHEPIIGSELCVRRDGVIYASGSTYSGQFTRYNRDLTPVRDGPAVFGYYYGRMGGGYFGNHGCRVTPDGQLFVCAMFNWCQYAVLHFGPDGKAVPHERLKASVVPWSDKKNYDQAGVDSALIGWLPSQCGGLAVGPDGSIYLGVRVLPRDHQLPEPLAKAPGYAMTIGSIVRFRPTGGGMYPDDGTKGLWKNGDSYQTEIPEKFGPGLPLGGVVTQHGVRPKATYAEGATKAYPGLAPFSGWNRSDGCVCQSPRFDVDGFGRLYVPNALTCSVSILDNEGNELVRFGQYANRDNAMASAGRAGVPIPLAYPVAAQISFKHIYVADSANRRVVRVDPSFAAEASCLIP